jgi:hypothetical protein
MRRTLLALAKAAPFLTAVAFAGSARADSEDDQKAAARLLGTEGVRAAMSGDCASAVDKLTRAEALVHAPTTALPLARCEIQLGKVVAGIEILNRLVHETLSPSAPRSWVDAQKAAGTLLDSTEPRIAKLRIHLDGVAAGAPNLKVTVDGENVPTVLLDNDRPTDPGPHHVAAVADGFASASSDVTLTDGQSLTVPLHLDPRLQGPTATAAPAVQPAAAQASLTATAAAPMHANRTPAYVSFGIGGAGLIAGTIFGVLALSTQSHLNTECNASKECPTSAQSDVDGLHTDALVSTIGFGVGVVAVGLGTYFLLSAHDEAPSTTALVVRPWLGPTSAGIAGSFR